MRLVVLNEREPVWTAKVSKVAALGKGKAYLDVPLLAAGSEELRGAGCTQMG